MNTEVELPADVIAELEANRKITAIKLLRADRGMDLKKAKELVDAYIAQHPASSTHPVPKSDSGIGRIVILAIGVGVIYGIYKYFS
jgi:ribosomal protein L7/L12